MFVRTNVGYAGEYVRFSLNLVPGLSIASVSIEREEGDFLIELIPFHCKIVEGEITLLEHLALAWIDVENSIEYDLCIGDYDIVDQLKR